jgi:CheY-like chemotaxis protein
MPDATKNILLVEPEPMLRRTVAMTARSLNLGQVHEAATNAAALRLLSVRTFQGAVIAVDCVGSGKDSRYDLGLIDRLRADAAANKQALSIAIMTETATPELLSDLRERRISRVILKPFRARVVLDTIETMCRSGKT